MSKYILSVPYVMFACVIAVIVAQVPAALTIENAMAECDAIVSQYDRGACYSDHFTKGN